MPRGRPIGPPQPAADAQRLEDEGASPGQITLAVRLSALRIRAGWTHQQLATAAGINRAIVAGIESGVRDPTLGTLRKLRDALSVEDWNELLGP